MLSNIKPFIPQFTINTIDKLYQSFRLIYLQHINEIVRSVDTIYIFTFLTNPIESKGYPTVIRPAMTLPKNVAIKTTSTTVTSTPQNPLVEAEIGDCRTLIPHSSHEFCILKTNHYWHDYFFTVFSFVLFLHTIYFSRL